MADRTGNDWITRGTTIVSAILVFRVVHALGEAAWIFLRTIPYTVVSSFAELDFLIVRAVAVALAVTLSRWHEVRLARASLAIRMIVLLIIAVFAFLPLRLRISFDPVEVPSSSGISAEGN